MRNCGDINDLKFLFGFFKNLRNPQGQVGLRGGQNEERLKL